MSTQLINTGLISLGANGSTTFTLDYSVATIPVSGIDFMVRRVNVYVPSDTGMIFIRLMRGSTILAERPCISEYTTGRFAYGSEENDMSNISIRLSNTNSASQQVELSYGIFGDTTLAAGNNPGIDEQVVFTNGLLSVTEADQFIREPSTFPVHGLKSGYLMTYSDPVLSGYELCASIGPDNYVSSGPSSITQDSLNNSLVITRNTVSDYGYVYPTQVRTYPCMADSWYIDLNSSTNVTLSFGSLSLVLGDTGISLVQGVPCPSVRLRLSGTEPTSAGTVSGQIFGNAYSFAVGPATTVAQVASDIASGLRFYCKVSTTVIGTEIFCQSLEQVPSTNTCSFSGGTTGLSAIINVLIDNTSYISATSTANNLLPLFSNKLRNSGYCVRVICEQNQLTISIITRDGSPWTPIHRIRRTRLMNGADGELNVFSNSADPATIYSCNLYRKSLGQNYTGTASFPINSITGINNSSGAILCTFLNYTHLTNKTITGAKIDNNSTVPIIVDLVEGLQSVEYSGVTQTNTAYLILQKNSYTSAAISGVTMKTWVIMPGTFQIPDKILLSPWTTYSFYARPDSTFAGSISGSVIVSVSQ